MSIKVTKHAYVRAEERFGWTHENTFKYAIASFEEGQYILHDETLRDMFLSIVQAQGGLPYLYKGVVFIFDDDKLVTVYPITGHGAKELK